jgi:hypothetical protein
MIKASGFIALTLALSTGSAVGFLLASPYEASAHDAVTEAAPAERIASTFAALAEAGVPIAAAETPQCAAATWPKIDPACLVTVDGSPVPAARVVY